MSGLQDLTSMCFTQMTGLKKPGLSVYEEFRFCETCLLSRHMGVRSSRLAISVFVHWDWSGKSITETDLDFTFQVWLVSTKIIKNGINLLTNRDVVWKNQATCPRPKAEDRQPGFFQTMSRLVNRFNILYDFSGHKPDLEGKIQICFRYGFDRPVLSVL